MGKISISEYDITAGINAPLVFAFLSDLHECDGEPVFELLQKYDPDAVLISGDYVNNSTAYEKGIAFLTECSEKYDTFCSVGNHELKCACDIRAVTRQTGAVLLDNEYTEYKGVLIGGLSSGFNGAEQGNLKKTPAPDLGFLKRFSAADGYKILLSHHPEYYPEYIKQTSVQLTLSGHAHGGQWRFFGRGAFAPGQGIFPKYTSGMYDGRLIVSRGLGDSHSMFRINNPYEFIVIRIR